MDISKKRSEKNSNPHLGHRERLKQRFFNEGLDSFNEHQILELLLFFTIPHKDTNPIAHDLLNSFGSLSRVFNANAEDLQKIKGVGKHSSMLITLIPQLARAYEKDAAKFTNKHPSFTKSDEVGNFIKSLFANRLYEACYLFCLDNSNRLIHYEMVSEGTFDETPCPPRSVLEVAFRHKAKKVVLAHNHPSNIYKDQLRPSLGDIEYTKNLIDTLNAVDIDFVDHIIVGKTHYISMAEIGCLNK